MKSIDELTRETARTFMDKECKAYWDECALVDGFEAGAEWERKRDKWIRVKDELPEIGKYVSVFSSVGIPFKGKLLDNGWVAFFADGEKLCTGEPHHITHWQPLPEPPKQVSKT